MCIYVRVGLCLCVNVCLIVKQSVWGCGLSAPSKFCPAPLESPLGMALAISGSCSVELLEEWDLVSRAARDWSMLIRLLDDGSWRYFSGTYPT